MQQCSAVSPRKGQKIKNPKKKRGVELIKTCYSKLFEVEPSWKTSSKLQLSNIASPVIYLTLRGTRAELV